MPPTRRRGSRRGPSTPRQAEILTYVRDYQKRTGYSPTLQEIGDYLGISKVTVFEHLTALEKRGLVRRGRHKARSMELADDLRLPNDRPSVVPLAGRIAAGAAVEAVENPDTLDLETVFASRHGTYALQVRGDSMIDDQIRDGDYVIIERRSTAENGETVVALLENGEATLKRLYREKGRFRLQPANPKYAPMYVDRLTIQGVVIGVLRCI
ncbi:MAG: transcriptional repressor LexA [Phycisphaerae bacterium]|nr:transcriptional repressor LexA [Phycisphaerae bacterium]